MQFLWIMGMYLPAVLGSECFFTVLAFVLVAGAVSSFHMMT